MSATTDQHGDAPESSPEYIHVPVTDLASAVWTRRPWLAKVTGVGMLFTAVVIWLVPNRYESTVLLMPPDAQSMSGMSILSGLGGVVAGGISPSLGALTSSRTPGSTLIGVLGSRTAQDDIINELDLMHAFRCKYYFEARGNLTKETAMLEDKKTGLISVVVTDKDKYRARDIAKAYIEEGNKLLSAVNTSQAHNERVFLEGRLKSLKAEVDASAIALSQYSSKNATLNPQSQGQALIEAAAKLQGELITAQSELQGLKATYSDNNVRVRGVQAQIEELQSQLRKMGGIGQKEDGSELKPDQLYPSIRELPILGVTYSDLYRQLTIQETLYEALTRQYELARVDEAKELPTIKVLDAPDLAEVKSFPSRKLIVAGAGLVSAFLGLVWILVGKLWELADESYWAKVFVASMRGVVRGEAVAKAKETPVS